jgi:hypothetical protein
MFPLGVRLKYQNLQLSAEVVFNGKQALRYCVAEGKPQTEKLFSCLYHIEYFQLI